jgi:hypothetical protein
MVVDYIRKRFTSENVSIAFAYCDYEEGRTALELVTSLTKQLASRQALPQGLAHLHEQLVREDRHLSWEELERLLLSLCDTFDHNFILIDALDEVNIFQERERLLSAVRVLQNASVKIFFTSRPNFEDITTQFSEVPQIEIADTEEDIRTYLKEKVTGNSLFMNRIYSFPELEKKIVDTIISRASGM